MTKHPKYPKTAQGDKEGELGFIMSKNPMIESEPQSLEMFCPSCQRMMTQITSFRTEDFSRDESGSIACVRCSKCKLIYDSPLYRSKMLQLRAKGFRIPR
jgi:hypothetical protein